MRARCGRPTPRLSPVGEPPALAAGPLMNSTPRPPLPPIARERMSGVVFTLRTGDDRCGLRPPPPPPSSAWWLCSFRAAKSGEAVPLASAGPALERRLRCWVMRRLRAVHTVMSMAAVQGIASRWAKPLTLTLTLLFRPHL